MNHKQCASFLKALGEGISSVSYEQISNCKGCTHKISCLFFQVGTLQGTTRTPTANGMFFSLTWISDSDVIPKRYTCLITITTVTVTEITQVCDFGMLFKCCYCFKRPRADPHIIMVIAYHIAENLLEK